MKKNLTTFFLAFLLCCGLVCTHVHTEECGENGENCTHECYGIDLLGFEKPKK